MKVALLVVALSGCSFVAVRSAPGPNNRTCASYGYPALDLLATLPIEALAVYAGLKAGFAGESSPAPVLIGLIGGATLVSAAYGFVAETSCRKKLE